MENVGEERQENENKEIGSRIEYQEGYQVLIPPEFRRWNFTEEVEPLEYSGAVKYTSLYYKDILHDLNEKHLKKFCELLLTFKKTCTSLYGVVGNVSSFVEEIKKEKEKEDMSEEKGRENQEDNKENEGSKYINLPQERAQIMEEIKAIEENMMEVLSAYRQEEVRFTVMERIRAQVNQKKSLIEELDKVSYACENGLENSQVFLEKSTRNI